MAPFLFPTGNRCAVLARGEPRRIYIVGGHFMKRKLLSVLLTLCLAFSLLPTAALADEGEAARTGDLTYTTANETISGFTYTSGKMTINAENVTVENVTFGDDACLEVNTSGRFTLKNCTFNGKAEVRTPVTLNVGSATVTGNTFNGTKTDGTPAYYNAIEFAVNSGNKLSSATLSDNIFEAAIKNNYFSTYYYEDNAVITAENNVIKLANRGSNAIRISNVTNSNVTFNLNNNSYEFSDASGSSEYEGFIILQGFTKKSGNTEDFSKVTINISNLTSPSDASRLFYVWEDSVGLVSDNNPVIKGDSSIEKFFTAKVGDTYYKTLAAAVTAAKDGNTVKILRDVNTAERHDVVRKKLILDLNGQTITTTIAEQFMNIRDGGKLTVTDNSASKDGKIISPTGDYIFVVFKGELDFQAGTVDARGYWQYDNNGTTEYYGNTIVLVYGDTNDTENYATVTLGENANLIATTKAVDEMPVGEAYAIMVDKNKAESAYGVKVDIKGTTEHAGLYVNGVVKKTEGNVPVFNIYDGAVVDGQIYSAGYAKWNIYGGKITGSTGMEIRAGELNMTGGSLTGTATPTTVTPNGNGGTSDGAGLAIAQHTTKLPVIVNISDGTISGYSALYESNPQNNDSNSIAKVQIAVTGGNFAAINGGTNAVYSQDKTGFITGGYFTSKPAKEYIATGYYVVESDKDGYSCMISDTVPTKAQVIVNDTTAVTPPTNAHLTEADKTAIRTKTNVDGVAEAAAGSKNRIVKDAGVNASAVDASKLIEVEVAVDVAVSDVQKNAEGTAISTITFTAKPTATVKVDGNATGTPVPVENSMLNGQAITVKLPLPADFELKQIIHKSAGYADEYILQEGNAQGLKSFKIVEEDGVKIAVFTVSHFSTFELSGTVTYEEPSYSSGSSSYDPTYSVSTPSKTENGSVTVSPKSASKGDTVTVTVKPDSGYVLETLTVTDKNGNELTLKDKGNGKYTFTMPAGKVEVKATFMEDNSMLNFFYDVPNNAYFYEAVKWAVKNGITTGVGNDLFAPEQPCTRAQIVTFLWRAAGSPEPKGAASGMTDVVSGSYYEKAVAWAIENGITTGTTTTTFSPDATCTRAQAVTFLARALKAKAASAAEFSDVPTGSYFADAVAWAAANGVTEGIGGGLFGSDNDCTRGQIVTFLYRAYNK